MIRNRLIMLALGVSLSACTSIREKQLKTEIAQIEERVGVAEAQIEQNTSGIGSHSDGIRARAAYRPIQAWGASLSAAPVAQRTVTFQQTSRHGQIEHHDINNPWPIPDGEWFVEIDNDRATKARLIVDRFDFQPTANGLDLATPLDFHIESRIHAHWDPGPGGGIGTNIFIDGDKQFASLLRASFLPAAGNRLPYRLDLISPQSLKITITAHLGGIGNYGHPFEMKNLARRLVDGSLDLLFDQNGVIGPLPGGQALNYRLVTSNPRLTSDTTGVVLTADVQVVVTSPVS